MITNSSQKKEAKKIKIRAKKPVKLIYHHNRGKFTLNLLQKYLFTS